VTGRRATLTIYHDGVEHEKVDLEQFETESEMVQMMLEKGFVMKPDEEVSQIRKYGVEARKKEEDERKERMLEAKRRMEAYQKMKATEAKQEQETAKPEVAKEHAQGQREEL